MNAQDVAIAVLSTKLERVQLCLTQGVAQLNRDTSIHSVAEALVYLSAALVESEPPSNIKEEVGLQIEIVTPYPLPEPKGPVESPVRTVGALVTWAANYPSETRWFLRCIEQDFIHKAKSLGMGQLELNQLSSLTALRAALEHVSRLAEFPMLVQVSILQAFSEYIAKCAVTPDLLQQIEKECAFFLKGVTACQNPVSQ